MLLPQINKYKHKKGKSLQGNKRNKADKVIKNIWDLVWIERK